MVNLLKNNSTQGLYITEDEGGELSADNTPGEIDLDNLSLGDSYIYFDTLLRFEEKATFNVEEPDFHGWKTWQSDPNKTEANTAEGRRTFFLITVETDETTAENLKKLASLNNVIGDGQKFIVKQTASEAFEQFPNESSVLKNWAKVIIRGYSITEIATSGKDVKVINMALEQVHSRN